jgi:hypothetical protein
MTWLAWRQHRAQAAAGAAMLAAYLVLARLESALQQLGGVTSSFSPYLPLAIGVFWGAPLLARELEHGTHELAWTQSVSRRQWLARRLLLATVTGALLTAGLTALVTWGVPRGEIPGVGRFSFFDVHGIVPVASTLFGLALGTAVGGVVRRIVWSMGASFAVLALTRLVFETVRRWYASPVHATQGAGPGIHDWIVGNHPGEVLYHPASRFWQFQTIEGGAYLLLAAALTAFAFWWTTRRVD